MHTGIYRKVIAILAIIFIAPPLIAQPLPEKVLPLIINQDTFLANDTLWILDGKCFVINNANLIIQEGARIEGVKKLVASEASALVITRGARLYATGTSEAPIVFTSHEAIPERGDWGGIVLLGSAPVNQLNPTPEGIDLPVIPAGVDVHYGGFNPHDNSGELQYVRIEYAGALIALDNELNGLTCCGVGDGTVLDYIEVAYAFDDAFQFFGGTVNAMHLFALAPDDDAFDFLHGYRGNIQYAVSVLRNTLFYSANPNGIEGVNDQTGSSNTPITRPVISNMTVIGLETSTDAAGKGLLNAAFFRRNGAFDIRNSFFIGFPTGLYHNSINPDKNFCHNIVHAFSTLVNPAPFPTLSCDASTIVTFTGGISYDALGLINPFGTTPDFRPMPGSPALTNTTNFTGLPAFFQNVNYRGAFNATYNWLEGWAKYEY